MKRERVSYDVNTEPPVPGTPESERTKGYSRQLFLHNRVVPLLWPNEDDLATDVASGFLFRRDGRHFLVSAFHCLKDLPQQQQAIGIPVAPSLARSSEMIAIGGGRLAYSEAADVAVFRIDNPDHIRTLTKGWVFLTDDDVELRPSTKDRVIAGWPGRDVKQKDLSVKGRMLVMQLPEISVPHARTLENGAPLDMTQEPRAKTRPFMGAFNQSRNIRHNKFTIIDADHA